LVAEDVYHPSSPPQFFILSNIIQIEINLLVYIESTVFQLDTLHRGRHGFNNQMSYWACLYSSWTISNS